MEIEKHFKTKDGPQEAVTVVMDSSLEESLTCLGGFKKFSILKGNSFVTGCYSMDLIFDNSSHEECGNYNFRYIFNEYIKALSESTEQAQILLSQYISEYILYNYNESELKRAEVRVNPVLIDRGYSMDTKIKSILKVAIFSEEPELGYLKVDFEQLSRNMNTRWLGILCKTFTKGGVVKVYLTWITSDNPNIVKNFIDNKEIISLEMLNKDEHLTAGYWRTDKAVVGYFDFKLD